MESPKRQRLASDLRLILDDGSTIETSFAIMKGSMIVREDDDAATISIPKIARREMERVLEWAEHHVDNPSHPIEFPLKSPRDDVAIFPDEFDRKFGAGWGLAELLELATAAKFLTFEPLMNLMAFKIARLIENKSREELAALVGLPVLDRDAEEKLRKENAWIYE